jgi:hypothetical protein
MSCGSPDDTKTCRQKASTQVAAEANTGRLYAGVADGAIAVVEDAEVVRTVPLDAHPESFQLEEGSQRLFANVPGAGHIAVVDRSNGKTLAKWPLKGVKANYPMALVEARQRLLVGCRSPARLLVLDTKDGRVVASVEISGDIDDIFFDETANRIYLACGAGFVDVLSGDEPGGYARIGSVPSAKGARTALFDPKGRRLYVAAPRRVETDAAILVFRQP